MQSVDNATNTSNIHFTLSKSFMVSIHTCISTFQDALQLANVQMLQQQQIMPAWSPMSLTRVNNTGIPRNNFYPSRSCKRSDTLFQKSLLLFSTWRKYFYSQPTHFSSQPKKSGYKQSFSPLLSKFWVKDT